MGTRRATMNRGTEPTQFKVTGLVHFSLNFGYICVNKFSKQLYSNSVPGQVVKPQQELTIRWITHHSIEDITPLHIKRTILLIKRERERGENFTCFGIMINCIDNEIYRELSYDIIPRQRCTYRIYRNIAIKER